MDVGRTLAVPGRRYRVAVQRIRGVIQHYAWGDPYMIPQLLGVEPDGRPWAEWWIGTHPSGPARFDDQRPLSDVAGPLPYLLKVLAAREPLSLQTHPDERRAREGFERGRYPDPNAKPELLHALTPFEVVCGFRPEPATLELLDPLDASALIEVLRSEGFAGALEALLRGRIDVGPILASLAVDQRPETAHVRGLQSRYPDDQSVVVTLMLNHVVLQPGEALRLDPGILHAYLGGLGIELMGASDNVVRCGLTTKPVDVDELLAVVDPTPMTDVVLGRNHPHDLPMIDRRLVRLDPGTSHRAHDHEVAIEMAGQAWYLEPGSAATFASTAYVVTR